MVGLEIVILHTRIRVFGEEERHVIQCRENLVIEVATLSELADKHNGFSFQAAKTLGHATQA